jgi:hypothetical protein
MRPDTPLDHGKALHGERPGEIALARANPWRRELHPVKDLPDLLPAVLGEPDVYLSANRFYGCRRITHLSELGALFADLDYYNVPEFETAHPLYVLDETLDALAKAQIPDPTMYTHPGGVGALLAPLAGTQTRATEVG